MPSQRPIPSSRRSRTARPQSRSTRRSSERFNADTTDTRWRRELDADLLAMGRPEGPGCYCPANNAMRLVIGRVSARYPFMVMDNEAGLEHHSRRTTRDVEHLLIVTDPSQRGAVMRLVFMVAGVGC